MKTLSPIQQEHLASEAQTLCLCWRLTRQDGAVFGLTNHDQTLIVNKISYSPGAALEAAVFAQGTDMQPGRVNATGVLSSDLIQDPDLIAGVWNDCLVDVYRVDWQRLDVPPLHVWSGYLSAVERNQNGGLEAELLSLSADLQRPIGRVIQRRCDAELGDARCGAEADGQTCDQRFETCRDVFANVENFRGFPHVPGNDAILAGPAATDNDGGKR
ncbi:MAG: DUF2163 domain-containing protein [Pseudomonadota bacterium]